MGARLYVGHSVSDLGRRGVVQKHQRHATHVRICPPEIGNASEDLAPVASVGERDVIRENSLAILCRPIPRAYGIFNSHVIVIIRKRIRMLWASRDRAFPSTPAATARYKISTLRHGINFPGSSPSSDILKENIFAGTHRNYRGISIRFVG